MSGKGVDKMSAVDLAEMCGEQTANELRRIHPRFTVEMVARDFDRHGHPIALRTIKGWLAGNPPAVKHLMALIQIYGRAFLEAISAPALGSRQEADIVQQLDELETGFQVLRHRLAMARMDHDEGLRLARETHAAARRGDRGEVANEGPAKDAALGSPVARAGE